MIIGYFLLFFIIRIIEGEVFLGWDGGDKLKSQKDLAKGAKLGVKEDIKILDYYRFISPFNTVIIHNKMLYSNTSSYNHLVTLVSRKIGNNLKYFQNGICMPIEGMRA